MHQVVHLGAVRRVPLVFADSMLVVRSVRQSVVDSRLVLSLRLEGMLQLN